MRYLVILVLVFLAACGGEAPRRTALVAPAAVIPVPAGQDGAAQLAVALVGAPYRYGGATPDGFDCSGLVWYVYRSVGINMPRTAAEQRAATHPVDVDQLQPGDLLFFQTPADHVGIYVGDGDFVHAPSTGKTVERVRLHSPFFLLGFAGAGRPPVKSGG
jgi:murein DD-endopeptidase